jgi:hypothetical protein
LSIKIGRVDQYPNLPTAPHCGMGEENTQIENNLVPILLVDFGKRKNRNRGAEETKQYACDWCKRI